MELINVLSARKTAGDLLDLTILVDSGQGEEILPYGYRKGESFGIGQQIDDWIAAHPDFPVSNYVPPATVMPDLAPYQFRAMLKLSGKQDQLYAFIEAMSEPARTVAQSKLEYSLVFKRDNDLVIGAQSALGLSKVEMDALWLQAASII